MRAKSLVTLSLVACLSLICNSRAQATPSFAQIGKTISAAIINDMATEQHMRTALTIDKILLTRNTAWAIWTDGMVAGESLLTRDGATWKIIASGSKGPIYSTFMIRAGVPESDANAIGHAQHSRCTRLATYTMPSSVRVICYDLSY